MGLRIEPLAATHDRAGYTSGRPDLDRWFRALAHLKEQQEIERVFVALSDEAEVAGFYSLSFLSLTLEDLPTEAAPRLPRPDAIPAARIRRLSEDQNVRGQGMGELLLADAICRILSAGRSVAVTAIVVDAEDEEAVGFYEGFGFREFPLRPGQMFLLTAARRRGFRVPELRLAKVDSRRHAS